ncbi:hypothetical protein F2Q69_00017330 [Brassica cretica]|uniref:RING-type domain-containing protein n=1 Tax=Brassica cretica TaxID=69181 RepID=A0A8S9R5H0_BRACR|nr:hypothetical protein F2Q69_00017330 [Brassica cretica]
MVVETRRGKRKEDRTEEEGPRVKFAKTGSGENVEKTTTEESDESTTKTTDESTAKTTDVSMEMTQTTDVSTEKTRKDSSENTAEMTEPFNVGKIWGKRYFFYGAVKPSKPQDRGGNAINSDNNSPSTSVTHRESQIMENMVESGTQGSQETPFLEKQETSYIWEEEEECENEQSCYGEMSYDWFTEISRPRTYWEDLRQSRYLQVMNSRSDKDDICRLLERRTVSDFLQSGLREKIDKFIMSRVQTHPIQRIHQAGKEEQNCDVSEEEDDLSQTSSQLFASSPAGSWSSQDTGVTSTPDLLPLHNLQTNEMEIITEMRSQILHLQLEMSELRDSVKTCLDVNASLQKSIHRENPLKRKCCVCNETQVDTLLYRCGHMCTCLRCANELQCNGGKCPICYAKILDVVRVFVDSRT